MNRDDACRTARGIVDHPYRRFLLAVLDSTEAPVSIEMLARDLTRAVFAHTVVASDVASDSGVDRSQLVDPPESVVGTLASVVADVREIVYHASD